MLPAANNGQGSTGQMAPGDFLNPFNAAEFHIRALISRIAGATLVQVVATTAAGAIAPPGYVNVQPLVNMLDGAGNSFPHGVIFQLPYFRLQGGGNAVIIDPVVNDIGLAIFCDRDISSVVATKAQANPASYRMNDMSDGVYFGSLLGVGVLTQYVVMAALGIKIVSPTAIELDAPDIKLVAPTVEINATGSVTITTPVLQVNGTISATGNVTAGAIDLERHFHGGVQTGTGNTGGPTG